MFTHSLVSKTVPFQTFQFSISTQFKCKYTVYLSKTFLFQAIQFSQAFFIQTLQFSISMRLVLFNQSGATNPSQSGPGSNGNEGVLCIPQSSSITGASPSDRLALYWGHSLGWVLPLCRGVFGVFYSPSRLSNLISKRIIFKWARTHLFAHR